MPVESHHVQYARKIARWRKNRDAYVGEDAVKAAGKTYLAQPGGFKDEDYKNYVQRAKWYGATSRTVKGLTGAIFQKDPVITATDDVRSHFEDATLTGMSLVSLAQAVMRDVELLGRYGIILDYSTEALRPYWSGFPAEAIINWREDRINGVVQPVLVVVQETIFTRGDMFEDIEETQYRAYFINEQGQYQVDVYRLGEDAEEATLIRSDIPMRRGRPIPFIPFQIFGDDDLTMNVSRGPLDDLVDVNYAYYRHSADYEHGLFLTGLPTPVITGYDTDEDLPIGSLAAWVIPNPEAKAYLLEYRGQGLEAHHTAMETDKKEMATLGARLLEERPNMVETLGAVQLRHSGELGNLRTLTLNTSEALTKVVRWHHWLHGVTELVNDPAYGIELNTDFNVSRLSPQEIQALLQVWQAGAMSEETLYWNLQQGEVVPNDRTFEEEKELIAQQAPARLPFPDEDEPEIEPQEDAA